jgi:anti-sigma B factor antagonist
MSEQLTFSVTPAGASTAVAALNGELDMRTVLQAREVLCGQVDAGVHRLVVDLSGLSFIGLLGAHLLRDIQALLNARGGSIALACPQRRVARALQLTGTDQRIPVYDSVDSAVFGRVCLTERRVR